MARTARGQVLREALVTGDVAPLPARSTGDRISAFRDHVDDVTVAEQLLAVG